MYIFNGSCRYQIPTLIVWIQLKITVRVDSMNFHLHNQNLHLDGGLPIFHNGAVIKIIIMNELSSDSQSKTLIEPRQQLSH